MTDSPKSVPPKTALLLLATGFEEIEAVTPIDVLRRAGVRVRVVGVDSLAVEGAHGLVLQADTCLADLLSEGLDPEADLLVLPGGGEGSRRLGASEAVQGLVKAFGARGAWVGAICAAPALALAPSGLLAGKRATCYPGFETHFPAEACFVPERVVVDGTLVTSRGPGTALEFALTLVELLVGGETAQGLRQGMLAADQSAG